MSEEQDEPIELPTEKVEDKEHVEPVTLDEPTKPKKPLARFFNTSMITMLTMVILVGMGEKMAERFLPLYLIALGGGALAIGFLNGMDNLVSALYSFPGGYLSDKIGYKRALVVFNLMAIFGYSLVLIIPTWWAVIVGALFFISWTAISLPAVMSLVSTVIPKKQHTMGVTVHSLIRRLPMALGPIIGGLLIGKFGIEVGIRIAFGCAIGLAAVAIILQWFFVKEPEKKAREPLRLKEAIRNIQPSLWHLLVSDILIRFAEQIPYAFAVVWVVSVHGFSEIQFGYMTTVEMVTAVAIYIPVAFLADKFGKKKPYILTTFVFFTAFPFMLLICYYVNTGWIFYLAFVVRGLKEFGEPTRKALIMDLAPENAKANTFGVYYLIRDVIVALAAFGGAFLWNLGPSIGPMTNFLVAGGFGLLGVIYFAIFGRDLSQIKIPISPVPTADVEKKNDDKDNKEEYHKK
ncbi:MAG: MFS transporter [Candidatus Heimdallarchaeota archaeon]